VRTIASNSEVKGLRANLKGSSAMCVGYVAAGKKSYSEVRTWFWGCECDHTITNYQQMALKLVAAMATDEPRAVAALFAWRKEAGGQLAGNAQRLSKAQVVQVEGGQNG
jgi:hypothetical protein